MDKNLTLFTIFTFLFFSLSTSRIISFDTNPHDLSHPQLDCGVVKSLHESTTDDSNLLILPTTRSQSVSANFKLADKLADTHSDHVQKTNKDRTFSTPRSDFARFHAINRRFFDQHRVPLRFEHSRDSRPYRHFQNKFAIPRSDETSKFDAQNVHSRHGLSTRMKFKHDYGHQHRHHQHHRIRHNNKDVSMPKRKFVSEKMKSLIQHHKEKTKMREREVSFMKSIRKFLKHTFD